MTYRTGTVLVAALLSAVALGSGPGVSAAELGHDTPATHLAQTLQAGMDRVFSEVSDRSDGGEDPDFLLSVIKSSVLPRLAFARVQADTQIMALTTGSKSGPWVMTLEPGHPWLGEPGPTLSTGEVAGMTAVVVRPDALSRDWSGVLLTHELLHVYDRLYSPKSIPNSGEFYAYIAEMRALDVVSEGRFGQGLVQVLQRYPLSGSDELVQLKEQNRDKLIAMFDLLEATTALSAPASQAEREMRDGLYLMAVVLALSQQRGLSDEMRVEELNRVIKATSLYR